MAAEQVDCDESTPNPFERSVVAKIKINESEYIIRMAEVDIKNYVDSSKASSTYPSVQVEVSSNQLHLELDELRAVSSRVDHRDDVLVDTYSAKLLV
jgi:hypothetical protein